MLHFESFLWMSVLFDGKEDEQVEELLDTCFLMMKILCHFLVNQRFNSFVLMGEIVKKAYENLLERVQHLATSKYYGQIVSYKPRSSQDEAHFRRHLIATPTGT